MAGIGFELRRVLGADGLSGRVGALASGIFVVAGPWLMSIIAMAALQALFGRLGVAMAEVFQAYVIYAYALSLSLFSGLHHLFTRAIADLVWEGKKGEACLLMLRYAGAAALASGVIALPAAVLPAFEGVPNSALLRLGIVALFSALNVAWIALLFSSLFKRYLTILSIYGLGLAMGVGAAVWLGVSYGPGGALLGYAAGFIAMDLGFIAAATASFPPKPYAAVSIRRFMRRNAWLVASGALFYAGQWLDKFVLWAARGEPVAGTPLALYQRYDYLVYLAGLSVIPGLLYFVIYAETRLYTDLRHFLFMVNHASWRRIQEAKRRIAAGLRAELRDQSLLQGAATLAAAALALRLAPADDLIVAWAALGAAFFQFTLLTLLVFLYYFELYAKAFAAALCYAAMNGVGTLLVYSLIPAAPPGLSHLAAGVGACALAWYFLRSSVYRLDALLYQRALKPAG